MRSHLEQSQVDALVAVLRPFVDSYNKAADHIGDSDLYGDQPRGVWVTLGDCRNAARVLLAVTKELNL
jgi:hypothetical protein